jgi:3',5'-cyclic AMP phosphodiesterase CpdA
MANDRILFTLLHISDLHFGDTLGGYGIDELSSKLPALIRVPFFDGQLGHHYKALTALHDFYGRLLDRHPTCWVIVSGDITANGALTQFDMAHSYLGDRTSAPNFGLGLGLPEWPNSSISGNHDQWPGNNLIVGPHTIGLTKYFKRPFPIFDPSSTVRFTK